MDVREIHIEKLVHGGFGLGRSEGHVWLVPLTLPGDVVSVRKDHDYGGHVEGAVDEILEEGPGRVAPPCPAWGDCGGCHLQHADYQTQVQLKAGVLTETLSRAGLNDPVEPEVVTSEPWAWRHRAEFHVDGPRMGFFSRGSHRIVEVDRCPLVVPEISNLLAPVRDVLKQAGPPGHWNLDLVMGTDHSVVAVVRGSNGRIRRLADLLVGVEGITGCLVGVRGKRGFKWIRRGKTRVRHNTVDNTGAAVSIRVDARCFSQANETLNADLVRKVLEYATLANGDRVLELYSGAGNLSVPLALSGVELTTVESDRRSVVEAGRNLSSLGVPGAWLTNDTAASAVRSAIRDGRKWDILVVDPPRPGLKGLLNEIIELGPGRMVICSCEPSSLGRDLAAFTGAGWRIERIAMVDMFPQTYHMETVVSLKR